MSVVKLVRNTYIDAKEQRLGHGWIKLSAFHFSRQPYRSICLSKVSLPL